MPWRVEKRGSRYCVIKEGGTRPVPGGCHSTRSEAVKHQKALYAGESSKASSSRATVSAVSKPSVSAREAAEAMTELAKTGLTEDESTEGAVAVAELATATAVLDAPTEEEKDEFLEAVVEVMAEPIENPEEAVPLGTVVSLEEETDEVEDEESEAEETELRWEGILAVEGMPTDDGRFLIPGEIGEREPMPRPLQWQPKTSAGHEGSIVVGGIEEISHIPIAEFSQDGFELEDIPESAVVVWGVGHIENDKNGRRAMEDIDNGAGISLDLPPSRTALIDPETLEEVDPNDFESPEEAAMAGLTGEYLSGYAGNIAAATICTVPAFPAARLRIIPSGKEQVLVASAFGQRVIKLAALTAAAAGKAPLKPPLEWFRTPEADEPTPLTVTPEGRVYGHLALWGQCHTAFAGCEVPNPSYSDYAYFYSGGQIETAEGEFIDIGRITVGKGGAAKGGHASIVHGTQGAIEHYDDTGCVAAYVTATDGNLGIWLAGAVRSDVPAERIRDLRANPPSLDYRVENGHRELVAILSVPVPGFPIPRTEMRLVASGVVEEVTAVIVTGYWPEQTEEEASNGRAELRARKLEEMREVSTKERKRLEKTGSAMKGGKYPIANCQDAANAIQSIGRAKPDERDAVKRHIRRRVRALGCTNVGDDWR